MSPPGVGSYITVCKVCRHILHLVGVVSGVRSRYFLQLIGPTFQQVMDDVSSQQYPLKPRQKERRESLEEGNSNKGMCVLKAK